MEKNKILISVIALVCAVVAMVMSGISLASLGSANARMEELELENRYLQEQLNTLSAGQGQLSAGAYCHLMVNGWDGDAGELVLTSAIAQAVLPKGGDLLMVQSANVVLRQDIREISRQPVTLVATETNTSFEALLENLRFELPQLADGDEVDIWLEVVLSDGTILLSPYCSWYLEGGELLMVAG